MLEHNARRNAALAVRVRTADPEDRARLDQLVRESDRLLPELEEERAHFAGRAMDVRPQDLETGERPPHTETPERR